MTRKVIRTEQEIEEQYNEMVKELKEDDEDHNYLKELHYSFYAIKGFIEWLYGDTETPELI